MGLPKATIEQNVYRILVVSDAVNAKTGYSRVADKILETLHSAGHLVAQLAWYHNHKPALIRPWLTYTTYKDHEKCCNRGDHVIELYKGSHVKYVALDDSNMPVSVDNNMGACSKGPRRSSDTYGVESINLAVATFKPDIVITIGDQWMCSSAETCHLRGTYKHIMYAAVDGEPLPRFTRHPSGSTLDWQSLYKNTDVPVAYCDWAKDVINDMVGEECVKEVIPFGVNLATFTNLNKTKKSFLRKHDLRFINIGRTRGSVIWDMDKNLTKSFNILYVGRNIQRKNIPFLVEAVAKFKELGYEDPDRPVVFLFHSPYYDNGWNMDELIRQYNAYSWLKINPSMRATEGPPDEELNEIYNIADLHLHASAAEGWDLPCLESLAAGVITTSLNYSAPPSWGKDALVLIDDFIIRQEPITNLGRAYPMVDSIVNTIKTIYDMSAEDRLKLQKNSTALASTYSWMRFRVEWTNLINRVMEK